MANLLSFAMVNHIRSEPGKPENESRSTGSGIIQTIDVDTRVVSGHPRPRRPSQATPAAKRKKAQCRTQIGLPLHSLDPLIAELATRCRNTCRIKSDPQASTFPQLTTKTQRRARDLIKSFPVPGTA
jgi:hypothetical protein